MVEQLLAGAVPVSMFSFSFTESCSLQRRCKSMRFRMKQPTVAQHEMANQSIYHTHTQLHILHIHTQLHILVRNTCHLHRDRGKELYQAKRPHTAIAPK